MKDYFCYERSEHPEEWYPEDAIGWREWRDLLKSLPEMFPPDYESDSPLKFADPLEPFRRLHVSRTRIRRSGPPRVFVSHRRCDKMLALRAAWLVNREGLGYWVDVLDPRLNAINTNPAFRTYHGAVLLGAVIEMALLNCTHVLAIMTHRVRGTMWMPYEYGRVKDSSLLDLRAAAWFEPAMQPMNAPEYFHLGPKLTTETGIRNWCHFGRRPPSTLKPHRHWPHGPEPKKLPGS